MRPCYLFDLDGTLADCTHRVAHIEAGKPKDWRAFFAACSQDRPIWHMIQVCRDLHKAGAVIVYVSGRSDEVRRQTISWLLKHDLPVAPLFMRKAGDRRPDDIVKLELLAAIRDFGLEPSMVFDDRARVVAMWRANGIPCAQVAPGDF